MKVGKFLVLTIPKSSCGCCRIFPGMRICRRRLNIWRRHSRQHCDEDFGLSSPDQVTPDMRRQTKATNFGIVYGISDYGLSQNIGISRKQAKAFIDGYFDQYPKVHDYMDAMVRRRVKTAMSKPCSIGGAICHKFTHATSICVSLPSGPL